MYYDAHTHLNSDQLYPDWQTYLEYFRQIGGKGLVNIGVNTERNHRAISIAEAVTDTTISVKATIGIHPGEISNGNMTSREDIDIAIVQLEKDYETHYTHIVGIGECGIDSHYERNERIQELQTYAFHTQCQLASKLGLPIVIHSRDNFSLTLDIIKHYPELNIYFHCRGYTVDDIIAANNILPKLWIGFTGIISYPQASNVRESFSQILDLQQQGSDIQYLFETDAPYLPPQVHRGKQNQPSYIADIYDYVSHTRTIQKNDIHTLCQQAFQKLYNS